MKFKTLALALTLAATGAAVVPQTVQAQGQGAAQANFGQLISALNNINVQIDRLNALNDLTVQDVRVVNVEESIKNINVEALNNALNRNNTRILNLRNVLNSNTVVVDVLKNADINVSDVIAIDVLSGGDLILFYR